VKGKKKLIECASHSPIEDRNAMNRWF